MKLKPIYRYLGEGSIDLNARATARCGSCCPPTLPEIAQSITLGEDAAMGITGHVEPKAARLSAGRAIVVYRDTFSNSVIRYKVANIAGDLSVTYGAQATLVTGEGTLKSIGVVGLTTDKVLLYYGIGNTVKVRVLNVTGDVAAIGGLTDVNTALGNAGYPNNPIRGYLIPASTYRVATIFRNSDSDKPSVQILDIDSLDAVTFGTVAKGVTTSGSRHNVSFIDGGGVYAVTSGNRAALEHFSISGLTPTFNGTKYDFPTALQLPGTSYVVGSTTSYPLDETSIVVSAITTTATPPISSAIYSFVVEASGGVLSSTGILKQDNETAVLEPVSARMYNDKGVVVYSNPVAGSDREAHILLNEVIGDVPSSIFSQAGPTNPLVGYPEVERLLNTRIIITWETDVDIASMAVDVVGG